MYLYTELGNAVLAHPFLCSHWLPPMDIRYSFLCLREREQKRGEGEDKNQIGAEHNGE